MESIGRYRVVNEVARGGMGVVFRALDPEGSPVAVKLLLAGVGASPAQQQRFEREVEALLRLRHPHVVRLLDAGRERGCPWLAMEWIEGESLEARLARQGPLDPRTSARLVAPLARALEHCHERGVLHRDLKPGNVLLRAADSQPLLLDFGLARPVTPAESRELRLTAGGILGTPGYWAPEQVRGEAVGPATDVWGLGALLFALLTGVPPAEGDSLADLLVTVDQPRPRPSSLRLGVPAALDEVCARALALVPDARYPRAGALADALETWLQGAPARRSQGRLRAAALGLVLLGLLGAGVATAAALARGEAPLAPVPTASPRVRQLLAEGLAAWRRGDLPATRRSALALRTESPPAPGAAGLLDCLTFMVEHEGEGRLLGQVEPALAVAQPLERPLLEALRAFASGGDPQQVERTLTSAVEGTPRAPELFYLRGAVRRVLDDAPGAIEDWSRAIELDPEFVRALNNRGGARQERGDLTGAGADFDRALEVNPDFVLALNSRSGLRQARRDLPGALADLDRAVELEPGMALAWANRAMVRRAVDDPAGALADLDRALALAPRDAGMRRARASIRHATRDAAGAEADLSVALELEPELAHTWFERGVVRAGQGRWEDARSDLDRVLALQPHHALARANRSFAREQLGDLSGALEDMQAALASFPPGSVEANQARRSVERLRAASPARR